MILKTCFAGDTPIAPPFEVTLPSFGTNTPVPCLRVVILAGWVRRTGGRVVVGWETDRRRSRYQQPLIYLGVDSMVSDFKGQMFPKPYIRIL